MDFLRIYHSGIYPFRTQKEPLPAIEDGACCVLCPAREPLERHHINPKKGVILCKNDHHLIHHKHSKKFERKVDKYEQEAGICLWPKQEEED